MSIGLIRGTPKNGKIKIISDWDDWNKPFELEVLVMDDYTTTLELNPVFAFLAKYVYGNSTGERLTNCSSGTIVRVPIKIYPNTEFEVCDSKLYVTTLISESFKGMSAAALQFPDTSPTTFYGREEVKLHCRHNRTLEWKY